MIKQFLTICFLIFTSTVFCAKTNLHNKLHHMQKQIKSTSIAIRHDQHKQKTVEQRLKTYERSIGELSEKLETTQQDLDEKIARVNILKTEHDKLVAREKQQRNKLNTLIKKVYMNAQMKPKNSKNRFAVYERYLSTRYSKQLQKIKQTKEDIQKNQDKMLEETTALTRLRDQIKRQHQQLSQQKKLRERMLVKLASKIRTERDKLKKLKADKIKMEKVIKSLQFNKTYSAKYFLSHKKKMPWPTKGKIIVHFGDKVADSHMHANGVEIAAPLNTPVRAIAPGKIVFNDWMPGFGLLLIIDHGQGYMSVYGHNNAIYKRLGDVVNAGELIAKVGSSGGIEKYELYFSVRSNGKPLDPSKWCT